MKRPELLSPAGSPEALIAAVRSGADAVYLSFGDFNARRGAKNFSEEALEEAIAYCHLRGVLVYLTLNILLTDRELPKAIEAAAFATRCGIDAILVQDLGLLSALRKSLPDTALHASTQMTIHNLPGVRFCQSLGLSRVVLSRELSRGDLKTLCAKSPLELECFAHGALCLCYSGQCYLSSLLGERSGNRGLCAQPCRLAFTREGAAKPSYPLSLKDLSLSAHLDELSAMGLACLKLEGRMKRPEYVAIVTRIYKTLLLEARPPTVQESADLAEAFSREGFTQGYYLDQKGPQMFGHRGEGEGMSERLLQAARAQYQGKEVPTIPLTLRLRLRKDAPVSLSAEDAQGQAVHCLGPIPAPARAKPLDETTLRAQLSKMGGTLFYLDKLELTLDEGLSLPLSALNALRRDLLAQLEALRTARPARRALPYQPPAREMGSTRAPSLHLALSRLEQLTPALLDRQPARLSLPLELLASLVADLPRLIASYPNTRFLASLPRVVQDDELPGLLRLLDCCCAAGIEDVLCGTWGLLEAARARSLRLHGDYSLGIHNSNALQALQALGFSSATASFELNHAQVRDLFKPLPTEAIVYGRLPLMLSETCLLAPKQTSCAVCTVTSCAQSGQALTDRRGERFPIFPAFGGRSELYNAKTLYLADKLDDFMHIGLSSLRLLFTTESAADCVHVLAAYQGAELSPPADFTRGLYYRRVE